MPVLFHFISAALFRSSSCFISVPQLFHFFDQAVSCMPSQVKPLILAFRESHPRFEISKHISCLFDVSILRTHAPGIHAHTLELELEIWREHKKQAGSARDIAS